MTTTRDAHVVGSAANQERRSIHELVIASHGDELSTGISWSLRSSASPSGWGPQDATTDTGVTVGDGADARSQPPTSVATASKETSDLMTCHRTRKGYSTPDDTVNPRRRSAVAGRGWRSGRIAPQPSFGIAAQTQNPRRHHDLLRGKCHRLIFERSLRSASGVAAILLSSRADRIDVRDALFALYSSVACATKH